MFFLFFGTRTRRRQVGTGAFGCPYCLEQRTYVREEVRTWFHVFWVPLFPLGSAQESVRCTVCGNAWSARVLDPHRAA